ncbi:MAG: hypothetical protein FJ033_14085, partial [Chloroflexi bacterium]|nr:hypothetical protein [Chloroflexota bacterium]
MPGIRRGPEGGPFARIFAGPDAHGSPRRTVDERQRYLAMVEQAQVTMAERAAGRAVTGGPRTPMWNDFQTNAQMGMQAGVVTYPAGKGDLIHAYVARPEGPGPFPGVVLVHHMPGWDEFYLEFTRRFAQHGYVSIAPDLYCRYGHGTPDDVTARVRADGGLFDDDVVADLGAAAVWLKSQPNCNGKVGIVGTCSGGRHALLAASRAPGFDA